MDPYSYGWEKLHLAVHSLAGNGTRKERLVGAVVYSLIHITPERDLPPELREEFEQFMKDITSKEAKGGEGTVQATVDSMNDGSVNQAVQKVISFYDTVCRHREPN